MIIGGEPGTVFPENSDDSLLLLFHNIKDFMDVVRLDHESAIEIRCDPVMLRDVVNRISLHGAQYSYFSAREQHRAGRGLAATPLVCNRCGKTPAPNQARSLCDDCYPGTPLCQACYVLHAREVLADAEDDPSATFYHSNLRREKLQLAAEVVAAADTPAKVLTDEQYEQAKALLYKRYPSDEGARVLAQDTLTGILAKIRPPEVLRTLRQADMTDAERIALMEQNYRRLPDPPRFGLLEFMGMSPDEYAGWIMSGTVPERVMRVAGRRP